jgi:hypothetical protein
MIKANKIGCWDSLSDLVTAIPLLIPFNILSRPGRQDAGKESKLPTRLSTAKLTFGG